MGESSLSSSQGRVPPLHLLLALAVVAVWGTNFVVIRVALDDLPPLLFAALRFTFAFLPAAFFIRRPQVRWQILAAYGVLIGFGQFGLLYIAMRSDISPGLASLVVQSQVFFTIGLAMYFGRERLRLFQIAALLLASAGIAVILAHTDGSTTPLGLALVLVAALSWGIGNHIARTSGVTDMLSFVVWSSVFALPPLFIGSLLFEGPAAISAALGDAGVEAWAAVLWQSVGNTLFGYAAWGWLLARHPAATITPSALLVPVFGMTASAMLLNESLPGWKLLAAALVMGGLAINILWPLAARRMSYRA
ncbi:EamA family transporter [Sphingosinicella soli]|uniref:O-acetylserine/cysteine efflux transporter n=1 Tax=Sphingosinicella soli TaxID=333708 RepID=A0A7W7F4W4_9SPHN|nr:EamA family transporter [Sphingosinicella soli]MBB4630785.1 O-acetylserine/cysteine efflux transporter [Sphingosinicella soli]